VAQGTPEEMKREIAADTVSLTIANGQDAAGTLSGNAIISTARKALSMISGVTEIINSDNGLIVYGNNGALIVPEIVRALDKAQVKISSINISTPTLDDVFLKHTGRRIRAEGQQGTEDRDIIEPKRRAGFSFRRKRQEAA
jgi:ABC-2 type transport system ATP-binding protein